ncbi:recombinase family protein [Methylobacillus caricis]|uniref:recombinase family protein n=1 Tax=Methylobacillus caricis TaxID=1971611 RepID=UPI001CFF6A87|nr:recombinase family protein [Methylobacillus caricis]
MKNKITAIVYGRVSTTRQAEDGLPVESQVEQGIKKAQSMDAELLKVFTDEGISGRTSKRPAFQQAIAFCALHKVTYFIVWSTSRFARNKLDAAAYKLELKRHGTKVIYASNDIDSETDEGWFSESIFEIVDEHYSRVISKDTRRSMMKNAADGFFNGGRVPYGYIAVPEGKRKRLDIYEPEATIVRQIFRSYLEGAGTREIAIQLNRAGLLKRGVPWEKNTITLVLKNKANIGVTVFNRKNHADGIFKPEKDWVITKSHNPIIKDEDFEAVQRGFRNRTSSINNGSPVSRYVFTGILRCGLCNAPMQIETARGRAAQYSYYNCRNFLKGKGCINRRVSADQLDDWLMDAILQRVFTPKRMEVLMQEVLQLRSEWHQNHQATIDSIASQISDVERRQTKLYEILELHGVDAPNLGDLSERLRLLKSQKDNLQNEYLRVSLQSEPSMQVSASDMQKATDFMHKIVKECSDPKRVREFMKLMIKEAVMTPDSVDLVYWPERVISVAENEKLTINTVEKQPVHSEPHIWLPDLGSNQGHTD